MKMRKELPARRCRGLGTPIPLSLTHPLSQGHPFSCHPRPSPCSRPSRPLSILPALSTLPTTNPVLTHTLLSQRHAPPSQTHSLGVHPAHLPPAAPPCTQFPTQWVACPGPGSVSWKQEMPAAEPLEVLSPSVPWPRGGLQPGGDLAEGGRG